MEAMTDAEETRLAARIRDAMVSTGTTTGLGVRANLAVDFVRDLLGGKHAPNPDKDHMLGALRTALDLADRVLDVASTDEAAIRRKNWTWIGWRGSAKEDDLYSGQTRAEVEAKLAAAPRSMSGEAWKIERDSDAPMLVRYAAGTVVLEDKP
jgi:hypothetical protein